MMMSEEPPKRKKRVFISYSSDQVDRIEQSLAAAGLEVWRDKNEVLPGEVFADKIKQGLTGSDYFLLLITSESANSDWVRREISYAFELSMVKKTTIIPVMAGSSDLPFEFSGYMYIDFRQSFESGINALLNFFESQNETADGFKIGSGDQRGSLNYGGPDSCVTTLGRAKLGSLRYAMADRLTIDQVAVIWFDVFERRMEDEISKPIVSMACVEIIDRARREDAIPDLLRIICRNAPNVSRHPDLLK